MYRRVEDALPLHIKGWSSSASLTADVPQTLTAGISGDLQRKVEGLVFALNDQNEGLMLAFRSIYVVYEADPCANSGYLADQVTELNREQTRLNNLRMLVRALADQAASGHATPAVVADVYLQIVDRLSAPVEVQRDAAIIAIGAQQALAHEWIARQQSAPPAGESEAT